MPTTKPRVVHIGLCGGDSSSSVLGRVCARDLPFAGRFVEAACAVFGVPHSRAHWTQRFIACSLKTCPLWPSTLRSTHYQSPCGEYREMCRLGRAQCDHSWQVGGAQTWWCSSRRCNCMGLDFSENWYATR
eukprot:3933832-Amphidinium_carterae.1